MFEDLDDPQQALITAPIDAVTRRVARNERKRRFVVSGAITAVLVAGVVTTSALAGTESGDSIATTEPAEQTDTTVRRPASTSSTVGVTVPPAAAAPTTTAPRASSTTSSTVPREDPARLRDWSNVRFKASRGFELATGDVVTFAFTMYNEGSWVVAIDGGCPWFTHGGARVACSPATPDRLAPGRSVSGSATFYARAYATPPGATWDVADAWDPISPSTYYVHGLLRDQFVFDAVTGGNSRRVVALSVFPQVPRLTLAADPTQLTLSRDGGAPVAVTMRNDQPDRVWDWGCHELTAPVYRDIDDPPPGVPVVRAGESPSHLCADRGWREPGWSTSYTVNVTAAGLAPGEYRLNWGRTPEVGILDLTVLG